MGLDVPLGQLVGSFRFLTAGRRWEWSDQVASMHGYAPGAVVPTTELVLSHRYSDDKPTLPALIDATLRDGQPFSSRHRIIDARGRVHVVVVVGDRLLDEAGAVIGAGGFYVDVTDAYEHDVHHHLTKAVKELAARRAVIEQAKGILMFVYNLPPGPALHVLRWRSKETDTPLRDWCEAFVREVTTRDLAADLLRREVDHALLSAHENHSGMLT
ncbi:MAG TPA: PAS and ANTAR domain-containing protein [Mycobacterium sp.]|nr:PAS and ANTAR domain-containing protein [Mycobacterium sp.]